MRQMRFFEEKRKAVGCPSYAWPLLPFIVQVTHLNSWETFVMNPREMNLLFLLPSYLCYIIAKNNYQERLYTAVVMRV